MCFSLLPLQLQQFSGMGLSIIIDIQLSIEYIRINKNPNRIDDMTKVLPIDTSVVLRVPIIVDKALNPPNIIKTNDENTPKIVTKSVYICDFVFLKLF